MKLKPVVVTSSLTSSDDRDRFQFHNRDRPDPDPKRLVFLEKKISKKKYKIIRAIDRGHSKNAFYDMFFLRLVFFWKYIFGSGWSRS